MAEFSAKYVTQKRPQKGCPWPEKIRGPRPENIFTMARSLDNGLADGINIKQTCMSSGRICLARSLDNGLADGINIKQTCMSSGRICLARSLDKWLGRWYKH
jgi:hypothetical protein